MAKQNAGATEALLGIFHSAGRCGCSMSVGHMCVTISKYTGDYVVLAGDSRSVRTNVVAGLALTRTGRNLLLTARVLDKDNPDIVIGR
jgi:hypothetical protein